MLSDMMINFLKPRSVVQLLQPASRLLGLRPLASSSQSPHLLHNIQPSPASASSSVWSYDSWS